MENDIHSSQIDHISKMYQDGVSVRSIAKRFNKAPSTISVWLKKQKDGKKIAMVDTKKITTKEIIGLYNVGLSSGQIAEKLNASKGTIEYRLKKAGVLRTNTEGINLAIQNGYMRTPVPRGTKPEDCPNWKGGRIKRKSGYIFVHHPEHPRAQGGYVPEHIWVWERHHNKSVPKGYVIHHLNGIKDDNRPGNLFAVSRGDHNHLWVPYQKRIRELEVEIARLSQPMLFSKD